MHFKIRYAEQSDAVRAMDIPLVARIDFALGLRFVAAHGQTTIFVSFECSEVESSPIYFIWHIVRIREGQQTIYPSFCIKRKGLRCRACPFLGAEFSVIVEFVIVLTNSYAVTDEATGW